MSYALMNTATVIIMHAFNSGYFEWALHLTISIMPLRNDSFLITRELYFINNKVTRVGNYQVSWTQSQYYKGQ